MKIQTELQMKREGKGSGWCNKDLQLAKPVNVLGLGNQFKLDPLSPI